MTDDSNPIEALKKKYRKRMKRLCCCSLGWFMPGFILLIVAIALIISYSKYWNENTDWRRGLAYAGVVLLLVGFIMSTVGITFCFILCLLYRHLKNFNSMKPQFKPPVYEYGEAPYPQQPTTAYSQLSTQGDAANPVLSNFGVPATSPAIQSTDPSNVDVVISQNTKF